MRAQDRAEHSLFDLRQAAYRLSAEFFNESRRTVRQSHKLRTVSRQRNSRESNVAAPY